MFQFHSKCFSLILLSLCFSALFLSLFSTWFSTLSTWLFHSRYSSIYFCTFFSHLLCLLIWAASLMAIFGLLDSSIFSTPPAAHFSFCFASSDFMVFHPSSSLRPVALARDPVFVSHLAILFWIASVSLIHPLCGCHHCSIYGFLFDCLVP